MNYLAIVRDKESRQKNGVIYEKVHKINIMQFVESISTMIR